MYFSAGLRQCVKFGQSYQWRCRNKIKKVHPFAHALPCLTVGGGVGSFCSFWDFLALLSINLLSANLTKWSITLKQFLCNFWTNCLSVFDHFVILSLKGLRIHWRLIFGKVTRCSTPQFWICYLICFKFTPMVV